MSDNVIIMKIDTYRNRPPITFTSYPGTSKITTSATTIAHNKQ